MWRRGLAAGVAGLLACALATAGGAAGTAERGGPAEEWRQWRGPRRDGTVVGAPWPAGLGEDRLRLRWRVPLGPSYSSPLLVGARVYTTETRDEREEVVTALDRRTGRRLWEARWPGALQVPFFAAANGSWIRATPACDGESLYVAGMREVLVCLDAATGRERWRVDFPARYSTPLPEFGYVSSPLVDGEAVYTQAAAGAVRLQRRTGAVVWRTPLDAGGMMGSAFSSPVLSELGGRRQLLVQAREKLVGLDPESGAVLWEHPIPSFRGMNILTPTIHQGAIFTSAYGGRSLLLEPRPAGTTWSVTRRWDNGAQGYMCSPVVIQGRAYLHLRSQRFACIELATGKVLWTSSERFGKSMSLVAQGERILALDENGMLYLVRAQPERLEILGQRRMAERDTWAHLAVAGGDVAVRELRALAVYSWN